MALDAEFFDSIEIEVVKKKYYNANKVNAVFDEIRRQAEALSAENAMLRERLEQLEGRRVEIGDAVLSAQAIYQEIVRRANARADAIVAEAQRERARILDEGRARQDYAVHRVEEAFSRLRQMQLEQIDALNAQWQAFLCGLDTEDESEP
ncbi:MAG: DivIVA domain-containing protein, partial [Oscillospiraceae bacterium]|nr:DivIVA domain-containing protein [Oscillospiraceae bacterium]